MRIVRTRDLSSAPSRDFSFVYLGFTAGLRLNEENDNIDNLSAKIADKTASKEEDIEEVRKRKDQHVIILIA